MSTQLRGQACNRYHFWGEAPMKSCMCAIVYDIAFADP